MICGNCKSAYTPCFERDVDVENRRCFCLLFSYSVLYIQKSCDEFKDKNVIEIKEKESEK